MAAKSSVQIADVLAAHDFSAYAHVADIGGGTGHLLRAILAAAPATTGTLFDLPPVIEEARQAGPARRLNLAAGDFFTTPLPVADATILMEVLHDQLEAMTLADRLVVMNAGRIEQVGTPIELYERPQTLFVAGFIGSPPMNFLPVAELARHGRGGLEAIPAGAETAGVRPDGIGLVAPAGPAISLVATLELVEPVGGESHLHLRLAGTGQLLVVEIAGRTAISEGEERTLYLGTGGMHWFDASGQRIG